MLKLIFKEVLQLSQGVPVCLCVTATSRVAILNRHNRFFSI